MRLPPSARLRNDGERSGSKAVPVGQPLEKVRLPAGGSVRDAVATYRANPVVLYAEPNYIVHATQSTTPNGPQFPQLWNATLSPSALHRNDLDISSPRCSFPMSAFWGGVAAELFSHSLAQRLDGVYG